MFKRIPIKEFNNVYRGTTILGADIFYVGLKRSRRGENGKKRQKYCYGVLNALCEGMFCGLITDLEYGRVRNVVGTETFYEFLNSKIRNNPMHTEAKKLNAINPFSITFEKKKAEPLFFIPDFGAHALYQCFNRSPQNFGIPETRYLHELRNVFHRHEKTLKIDGYGIKYIQNINQLHADPDVSAFLKNLSVPKPSKF